MADRDPALRLLPSGYDDDFYLWSIEQTALLRSGHLDALDIENIAEEIESLGRSDRRTIKSQMIVLIEHLLKLQLSRDSAPQAGWRASINNARREIAVVFDDSPSLRAQRSAIFAEAWGYGVKAALAGLAAYDREAGVKLRMIEPVFSVDQALDPDFFPGA